MLFVLWRRRSLTLGQVLFHPFGCWVCSHSQQTQVRPVGSFWKKNWLIFREKSDRKTSWKGLKIDATLMSGTKISVNHRDWNHKISSEIFCPTVPKMSLRDPLVFFENFPVFVSDCTSWRRYTGKIMRKVDNSSWSPKIILKILT